MVPTFINSALDAVEDSILWEDEPNAEHGLADDGHAVSSWCVLVVDDAPEVHAVTRLALTGFMFEGRGLHIVSAYNAAQGREIFQSRSDIALAIVDVIMENDHAGLELVRFVRMELKNRWTRLVLRTGQSGNAPEEAVIRDYEIDDYKEKTELTQQKMRTMLYSNLRAYRDICLIESQKRGLESTVAQRTAELALVNQTLRADVARREQAERDLIERNAELNALNAQLSSAHEHLIQSEKMASIGQLAAGVAHEINNPIGYIFSNFGSLEKYLADLFRMLAAYEASEASQSNAQTLADIAALKHEVELEFLKEDIPTLMHESREGIIRVRKIVQDLKDFSHVDATQEWQFANLNAGIDSTLNVVNNEIKYKADVVKEYGELPEVQCMASQINQVVMNLVVNAAHAMGTERGKITVRTGVSGSNAWFEVQDTGSGIPKEVLPRIFDPFYTTKPVGKGTGLGLSLSYGIIQKHNGHIEVHTEPGVGTTFRVSVPLIQSEPLDAAT